MSLELILAVAGLCTLGGVLAGLVLARLRRPRPRHRRRTHRDRDEEFED